MLVQSKRIRSAADVASQIMENLDKTGGTLKEVYAKHVIDRRLDSLHRLKPLIERARQDGDSVSDKEFRPIVGEIQRTMELMAQEARRCAPQAPRFVTWLGRYKKQIALSAAAVVAAVALVKGAKAMMEMGHGLRGEYYEGMDFNRLKKTRTDKMIDFNWAGRPPMRGLHGNAFSVRWTGTLKAPEDGLYKFMFLVDDGVALTIDGDLVLRDWTSHKARMARGARKLDKGSHAITIEYFQDRGPSEIHFFWFPPSAHKKVKVASKFLSTRSPNGADIAESKNADDKSADEPGVGEEGAKSDTDENAQTDEAQDNDAEKPAKAESKE
ncbi:MAG: hypothetical protein JO102_02090 [Elusimicrobia bacterium]|nr:hypothetical protein [Elusimicrobiota bacterium]